MFWYRWRSSKLFPLHLVLQTDFVWYSVFSNFAKKGVGKMKRELRWFENWAISYLQFWLGFQLWLSEA